ncbi:MAG: CDGSH iron-sulfur domain-containing protein [Bacteroidota bacterium]
MATKIQVFNNGPIKVEGDFELTDQNGNRAKESDKKAIFMCRCGKSGNKPFCDGMHKAEFEHTYKCERIEASN